MKLYEITEAIISISEMLDSEDSAAIAADALGQLGLAESEKLENICKLIKNLDASAKSKKEESKRLADSAKADENKVAQLKALMQNHLTAVGKDKAKAGLFTVGLQMAGGKAPLVIDDGYDPDPNFFPGLVKTEYKWDNDAIRTTIEEGKACEFAHIGERKTVVSIR